MNKDETIAKVIDFFGSQAKLAKAIGVEQGTVTGWLNRKHGINAINALKIEKATNGKFKAVDLCPKLREIE